MRWLPENASTYGADMDAIIRLIWILTSAHVDVQELPAGRSPALLGAALLRRAEATDAVLAFSVLHVLAFVLFGLVTATLVAGADEQPSFLLPLVILSVAFEVFIFAVVLVLARWVFDELAGWAVVVGNLLAATGMLAYYFRGHPRLVRQVRAVLTDESE